MDRPLLYGKNQDRRLQTTEIPFVIGQNPDILEEHEGTGTSQVRFLDAIDNYRSFNIRIDDNIYIANLAFGDATNYETITEGNHRLVVTVSAWPEEKPLFDRIVWVPAGQIATMVLTESAEGIDLTPMNDMGCPNLSRNLGCLRIANMSYPNSTFDILYEDEPIVQNLRFKAASWYRETLTGDYELSVINSTIIGYREELPILVTRNLALTNAPEEILLNFSMPVESGVNYTAYLMGTPWSLQAVVL